MRRLVAYVRRNPVAADRALVLAVWAASLLDLGFARREGPLWANALLLTLIALSLLWRRRRPLAVAVAVCALVTAQTAFLTSVEDLLSPFVSLLLIAFAAGAHAERRRALVALPLFYAAVVAVNVLSEQAAWGDYLFPAGFATTAWLAGRSVRARSLLTAELHEAAVRAQEAREEDARWAGAEERRRIAREMHDVVAHSISVMVVQAGGARRIIDRDPARAAGAAALIEDTGRAALVEMRRLLGLLTAGGAELAPQPGMDRLSRLVAQAREAGLPVLLRVDGEPHALAPGVDLAAYRIVQEALTNVLKHAPGAATEIAVNWSQDALELTIADRGPGPADGGSAGHGLVGMEERVRLYGGELHAGPRPGGGFEVRARLPLAEPAEVAA